MEAAPAFIGPDGGVTLHQLRAHVGAEVAVETASGPIEGTLLSCTTRSAWIVAADVDHVVALPHLLGIRRR
jgi:hypothetical protein